MSVPLLRRLSVQLSVLADGGHRQGSAGDVILFQGDSITHGGRLKDLNHYLGHGFATEIAMRYLAYAPELKLEFANRGVSGSTSRGVLERWDKDGVDFTADERGYANMFGCAKDDLKRKATWFSLLCGVNEQHFGVAVEEYGTNLAEIVRRAYASNPKLKLVLCEPFRVPHSKDPEFARYQAEAEALAKKLNVPYVRFQKLFDEDLQKLNPRPGYWNWDGVHPSYAGHMHMADFWLKSVADFMKAKNTAASPAPSPMLEKITTAGLKFTRADSFFGYRRFSIDFDGWEGWIVEPQTEKLRKDGAWVWCMKWPGAFAEGSGQIDCLRRGYYYVYLDNKLWMSEEGARKAKAWQDVLVTKLGLKPKTYLVGMSWGGFFSTRYAATYPDAVAKIYLDNPVMSFHAFDPFRWDGVGAAWGAKKGDGHDWRHDPRMPINLAGPITAAKIPVLLLYGDKDTTCVPEENCLIFRDAFQKAGGDLTVVCRPGKNHHPHGFIDPVDGNKVIDFFER